MEYKIVVTGGPMVGKTCLINRFVRGVYCESEYVPTLEDSYRKVVTVEQESCLLDITDTSGDPLFSTFTESKIREGDGFLCLFPMDDFDSFEIALDFLLTIKLVKKGTSPCILFVGSKSDMCDREVSIVSKYWTQFYNIPHIETSAKLNVNVDRAFLTIVNLLRQKKIEQVLVQEERADSTNCCTNCCTIS